MSDCDVSEAECAGDHEKEYCEDNMMTETFISSVFNAYSNCNSNFTGNSAVTEDKFILAVLDIVKNGEGAKSVASCDHDFSGIPKTAPYFSKDYRFCTKCHEGNGA